AAARTVRSVGLAPRNRRRARCLQCVRPLPSRAADARSAGARRAHRRWRGGPRRRRVRRHRGPERRPAQPVDRDARLCQGAAARRPAVLRLLQPGSHARAVHQHDRIRRAHRPRAARLPPHRGGGKSCRHGDLHAAFARSVSPCDSRDRAVRRRRAAGSRAAVSAMSIDAIAASRLRIPLVRPYRLAFGAVTHYDTLVVEIVLDDGRSGYGEATLLTGYTDETIEGAWDLAADLVETLCGLSAGDGRLRLNALASRAP